MKNYLRNNVTGNLRMSYRMCNKAQCSRICCMSQALADSTNIVFDLENVITSFSTRRCRNGLSPFFASFFLIFTGRGSIGWAASAEVLSMCSSIEPGWATEQNNRAGNSKWKVTFQDMHFALFASISPSLIQSVAHLGVSCWKLECNCQLKLILACIIKEMMTYTDVSDVSDVSHHLTNRHNFPLFFFFQLFSGKYSSELGFGLWSFLLSPCCLWIASLGEYQTEICLY